MPLGHWPPSATESVETIFWPCGPDNSVITAQAWFSMLTNSSNGSVTGIVYFNSTTPDGKTPIFGNPNTFTLTANVPWGMVCPPNTCTIVVVLNNTADDVAWSLELQAK